MAGSRLERFGTVFTRVRDLMRSGVIKPSQKPIWYDVYQAFPPKTEPRYVKPHVKSIAKKQETVPEIFYREDEIRARFYEQYTSFRTFDLSKSDFVSLSQRFVDKYTELESRNELEASTLFEETGKALLSEGLVLRRSGARPVSPESPESSESPESEDPVLEPTLTDPSVQLQAVSAEETTDATHTPQQPEAQ
ncbi:28S ribosomal protein S23, mitochondrial [Centropristis striata]|uniref:28S ribosomal protein S23, mitochondrial n=1 Tax=Centropristis striata TaxID=184440 RepID=UPI0027DF4946|nr:28S ribosomal protein S23, mitochondrial [Centropristis striata]